VIAAGGGVEPEILGSLCEHRVLSTPQIREIHLPGHGERWAQRVMAGLARRGLVGFANLPALRGAPRRLWYVSEAGAAAAREAGVIEGRARVPDPRQVTGPLQAHTLAVNEVGICFLRAARERGEEFGATSWRHEVSHPLSARRGRARRAVIADAVLTYLRRAAEDAEVAEEEIVVEQRFVELDRATLSVDRLVAELGRYGALHRARSDEGEPLWRDRYAWFPPVICVLAGASRRALRRRRDTALALLAQEPELERAPEVSIRFCLAEELAERGPFAPIFTDARAAERAVSWVLEEPGG
jgi:hypothetical protein